MSNNNSASFNSNEIIRPRSVYVSTDDVLDFSDASSFKINLQEQIVAEEGFDLVWGLRSIGANMTAYNISARLANNTFIIRCTYIRAGYEPAAMPIGSFDASATAGQQFNVDVRVVIPDGLYNSLDNLFDVLSNSNDVNYFIDSGYMVDFFDDPNNYLNRVPLKLIWKKTFGGFSISPEPNTISVINHYEDIAGNPLTANDVFDRLFKVLLLPDPDHPKFWYQMFYNKDGNLPNVPPSSLSQFQYTGLNPPNGISFTIQETFPPAHAPPNFIEQWVPLSIMSYYVAELGNESSYNNSNATYPNPGLPFFSLPYRAYFTPIFHPLFIDFSSSLSSKSVTKEGHKKGILIRQFITGGDNGVTSLYNYFNTPVWNVVDSPVVSTLSVDLSAESNLWDFYNMSFVIELIFFEVERSTVKTQESISYAIPPTDVIQESLRHRFQSRYAPQPTGEHHGVYLMGDDSSRLKKRSR